MPKLPAWFSAELAGTFLLVFIGCSSVAVDVALGAYQGVFQVAATWGLGLAVAIYLMANHSGAHFNPAITLAFAIVRRFPKKRVPGYLLAQFVGAFLAAAVLYAVYGGAIAGFETDNGWARGEAGSEASAMIFGEYYPNPGGAPLEAAARERITFGHAFLAEFIGTALLAFSIFGLTHPRNTALVPYLVPLAIGMTLTVLICLFGPVSMGGFNPARDLAPRAFSSLVGWGSLPFTVNGSGWFTVYVLAPCLGAVLGAWLAERLFSEQATRKDSEATVRSEDSGSSNS